MNAAGKKTSEGYFLSVARAGITIAGASPLGAWWGTRSVLQQAVLNDKKIKFGAGVDAAGWSERGMMVSSSHPILFYEASSSTNMETRRYRLN